MATEIEHNHEKLYEHCLFTQKNLSVQLGTPLNLEVYWLEHQGWVELEKKAQIWLAFQVINYHWKQLSDYKWPGLCDGPADA